MLVLPVTAAYFRLVFLWFVGVYLCTSVILQRLISLHNTIQPSLKAARCKIFLWIILYSARNWYIKPGKTGWS